MLTLIYVTLLASIIITPILLFLYSDTMQRRKEKNQLFQEFTQAGSNYDLSFSSQEILTDTIIGLDGLNRRILLLSRLHDQSFQSFIFDLHEVKYCSIKKEFATFYGSEYASEEEEQFLATISLYFDLHEKPAVEVIFYNHLTNHLDEIAKLENKAKRWEIILSKMLTSMKKAA